MSKLIIGGKRRLAGRIRVAGNKNAAAPVLAATLLTDQPLRLGNIPDIEDVRIFVDMLRSLGARIEPAGESWEVSTSGVDSARPDRRLGRQIRMSLLLAGPLLARFGRAVLPFPGGDVIGRRRVDTHLQALQALGVTAEVTRDGYRMAAPRLRGNEIFLDEMSVTATENALLAAVLADGSTRIRNAASEPHVQDLCHFLNTLGARIEGIGTNVLTIAGVPTLSGGEFRIGPDYIETGSLIGLAAASGSALRIVDCRPEDHAMTRIMYGRLGIRWTVEGDDIVVPDGQRLEVIDDFGNAIPKIDDAPWPGFPADLIPIALVVATQARGSLLIHEKLFESRLYFVDRLIQMGARIVLCDPHRAVVVGPANLYGQDLASPDIRAGMALLIAALCSEGRSVIRHAQQIDRGYERIDERLAALGADIRRE
ncbi:MAG TPA: UDP-N-acetylglucosamine 1-carboxyvinyltransferase [Candidatus Kryptonia bacterium]|nr:UDP-N-acetylglucosamine 1-carboxyvinyltransferase [Candidatus Kryptonia bacterium]